MRLPGIALAVAGATLSWGLVAPPAQASLPAIMVASPEDWQSETQLSVWVSNGSLVTAGDLIITRYKKSRWDAFHVYLDPESGSSMTLGAGASCSYGVPEGSAPMPEGTSLLCDYVETYSTVTVDLSGSTYPGGDFTVTNTLNVRASFRGSDFADYYQGGPGKDSIGGRVGHAVLFGGDGAVKQGPVLQNVPFAVGG